MIHLKLKGLAIINMMLDCWKPLYIKKEKPELNDGLPMELALLHLRVRPLLWLGPLCGLLLGVSPPFSESIMCDQLHKDHHHFILLLPVYGSYCFFLK